MKFNSTVLRALDAPTEGFVVKKYKGVSQRDYAVFKAEDVVLLRAPVQEGEADPIVAGLDRTGAFCALRALRDGRPIPDNL